MLYQNGDITLRWSHNGRNGVSNHHPHDCLLNRRKSKKTSKLRVTGLCAGNSPVTNEFPAQMASNPENVSIWWRHHDTAVIPSKFVVDHAPDLYICLSWLLSRPFLWSISITAIADHLNVLYNMIDISLNLPIVHNVRIWQMHHELLRGKTKQTYRVAFFVELGLMVTMKYI